jgi:predicted aldo/keto reductase-like oxidoreductase
MESNIENRHNAIQQPTEVLLREIDMENYIREQLHETQIYFDYNLIPQAESKIPLIRLDLITINKEHNQKFLFHSLSGSSKISILEDMITYIKEFNKNLESYEIQWLDSLHNAKTQTSWFRGKDIFDVLNKFYYDKEKSRFKILKIKLMPEA